MSLLTKELFLSGARFKLPGDTLSTFVYIKPGPDYPMSYGRIERFIGSDDNYECSVITVTETCVHVYGSVMGVVVDAFVPFAKFEIVEPKEVANV
jgi:hypothetical protein